MSKTFTRRNFMKLGGAALAATTGAHLLPSSFNRILQPVHVVQGAVPEPDLFFAATDGWISLPVNPATTTIFHPDPLGPLDTIGNPFTTYIFGFRNVTGLDDTQIQNQKNKAQHSAPLFWTQQDTPFQVKLTNLGLALRPDLVDTHTFHWHGFRNVIPFFDGEPSSSVSVPIGRDFTYVFNSHDPGTYMYHCHVEDVEHVQMGMTGLVFVRPYQDSNTTLYPSGTYVYNDGDGSTGYDREFAMFLSEVWAESHWADAHIQLPEWSDYKTDFALLNGRVYPDTLAPNGSIDPFNPVTDPNGDLIATAGYEHLQYQPLSSLVNCIAGERVLLRFANLGFKQAAMTLTGIKMQVVGRDATFLRNGSTSTSYATNTVSLNAGESADVIFIAPPYQGPGAYDTYLLYNRSHSQTSNLSAGGYGGQMTEVRVYPSGVTPQTGPNT